MGKKTPETETVVIAKCITCQKEKEIKAGEVPPGETPMCDRCFMPMVAVEAKTRSKKS